MPRCSILLCKNDSRNINMTNGGVSYHRFPKNPKVKEKWMDSTGRINWFPSSSNVICSDHFEAKDFLVSRKGNKYMSETAVPSKNYLSFHAQREPTTVKSTSGEEEVTSPPVTHVKVEATPGPSRKRAADSSIMVTQAKVSKGAESDSAESINLETESSDNDDVQNLSTQEKELKGMVRFEKNVIKKQNIKLKELQRKLKRLKMTITGMEDLYTVLNKKLNIPLEDIMILETIGMEVSELVVRRQTNKELSEVLSKLTYSSQFRSFALYLHFISAKAYDYVRETFKTSLPHPRTLKHWYLKTNGEPGFIKEAFVAMKHKADESQQHILATLVVADMQINRHVEVDGKLYGYVDVGAELDTHMLDEAREVLALSVTAINGHFSLPVAYFLTSHVRSDQRAALVKFALEMSHDAGIKIVALSCDENMINMNMVSQLKCESNSEDGHVSFLHPVSEEPIVVILDPTNLLEQLRDALRDHETLTDKDDKKIQWKFFKELDKILYLSDKVKDQYVDFQNARIKVKLATELFSPKIADALQYCRKDLQVTAFKDSEPTQTFVTLCSTIYDVFNSANSHVYGFKNALDKNNAEQIFELLNLALEYIIGLKTNKVGPAIRCPKISLSFFAGIKLLYSNLIETDILDTLHLYKLSQDHLKLLFWNIKVDAGRKIDSNLTPKMVCFAYKKLVAQIKNSKSLNPPLEKLSIPLSPSPVDRINRIAGRDLTTEDRIENDLDLQETLEVLSNNNEVAVVQIAAYIVQQLIQKINCDVCVEALVTTNRSINSFIIAKDKTRLLYPSLEVVKVCKATERFLKVYDGQKSRQAVQGPVMVAKIMRQFVDSRIFDGISYHQVGEFPQSNHVTDLMKALVERYSRVHYKFRIKRETYKDFLAQMKEAWMLPPRF